MFGLLLFDVRFQGFHAQLEALGSHSGPGGRQARTQRNLCEGLHGLHDGLRLLQHAFHGRGGGNLHVVAPRLRKHLLLILFH